jgi:hypothetical protein
MDAEQWPEDDPETTVRKCGICGQVRPCQRRSEPFVVEAILRDGPDGKKFWCLPCYDQRWDVI